MSKKLLFNNWCIYFNRKFREKGSFSNVVVGFSFSAFMLFAIPLHAQRPMEYLDRGLVAVETESYIFLSWRMLGTDDPDVAFNIYKNGDKINVSPIHSTTNFVDTNGSVTDTYSVETISEEGESTRSEEVPVWGLQEATENPGRKSVPFKRIPLPAPPVEGDIIFIPGDMSVGDLNGDGEYEIIFEWESDNANFPYLQAIDLEGNSLWRIEGGVNTNKNKLNFMVYDLDMDGKAEVAVKTGPGTKDGLGNYLSKGPAATDDDSYVIPRPSGRLMGGPVYITVFNGETGEEMATVDYHPPLGDSNDWGDSYGHRASSLKAAVLYDKDLGPLLVYTRGIYDKIGMAAYTWNGSELEQVWTFDSSDEGNEGYAGMGNHSVGVGDVDGDGSDELMYGAMAIDNDGTGLYTTGRGHGDAHYLTDHMPDRPGLEYFQPHENSTYGITMRDAATGEIIWEILDSGDIGRAWAADVDPDYRGSEVVAALSSTVEAALGSNNFDQDGNPIQTNYNPYNAPLWFSGSVYRGWRGGANIEGLVDGEGERILTGWYYGATTIHDSKKDANLVADILGDWREEVILPHKNNSELLLFSTWLPTERKNYTLMHDPLYRMNIVVQNVGYNQPSNVGYYFADGAPDPNIYMINDQSSNPPEEQGPTPDVEVLEGLVGDCEVTDITPPTATSAAGETITGTTEDPLAYTEEGEYTITWVYTDSRGNIATQEQSVTIEDTTPPTVLTRDISIEKQEGEIVTISPEDVDAGSEDNCSEVELSLDISEFRGEADYVVELTAVDASGNESIGTATVSISISSTRTGVTDVHVVPTLLENTSIAKVIVAEGSSINRVEVVEAATGNFRVFQGNNQQQMEIDTAPLKGILLVKIFDGAGEVHLKKLIAL